MKVKGKKRTIEPAPIVGSPSSNMADIKQDEFRTSEHSFVKNKGGVPDGVDKHEKFDNIKDEELE